VTDRLGLDLLTVRGTSAVECVHLAADLGCRYVSTALGRLSPGESTSLRSDPGLRREMRAALDERGVSIGLVDGVVVGPNRGIDQYERDIDVLHELGAPRVNTLSFHADWQQTVDDIGRLTELMTASGIEVVVEAAPTYVPESVPSALDLVAAVGSDLRLLIDTMHMGRSGVTPPEIAALDPALIGYVQLSDVPVPAPAGVSYRDEAETRRLEPGAGDLPLAEYLAAVPNDVVIGLEVPNSERLATLGPRDWAATCVRAARALEPVGGQL